MLGWGMYRGGVQLTQTQTHAAKFSAPPVPSTKNYAWRFTRSLARFRCFMARFGSSPTKAPRAAQPPATARFVCDDDLPEHTLGHKQALTSGVMTHT